MRVRRWLTWVGVGLMAAQACTGAERTAMEVTLLVFSGRPNPKFAVTDPAVIAEITGLVSRLPVVKAAGRATVVRNRLGYSGIQFEVVSPRTGVVRVDVFHDEVEVRDGAARDAPPVFRSDRGEELEKRLLDLGVARGAFTRGLADAARAER